VFASLDPISDGAQPISENVVIAKQLADLFLVKTARDRWQQSLSDWQARNVSAEALS